VANVNTDNRKKSKRRHRPNQPLAQLDHPVPLDNLDTMESPDNPAMMVNPVMTENRLMPNKPKAAFLARPVRLDLKVQQDQRALQVNPESQEVMANRARTDLPEPRDRLVMLVQMDSRVRLDKPDRLVLLEHVALEHLDLKDPLAPLALLEMMADLDKLVALAKLGQLDLQDRPADLVNLELMEALEKQEVTDFPVRMPLTAHALVVPLKWLLKLEDTSIMQLHRHHHQPLKLHLRNTASVIVIANAK